MVPKHFPSVLERFVMRSPSRKRNAPCRRESHVSSPGPHKMDGRTLKEETAEICRNAVSAESAVQKKMLKTFDMCLREPCIICLIERQLRIMTETA